MNEPAIKNRLSFKMNNNQSLEGLIKQYRTHGYTKYLHGCDSLIDMSLHDYECDSDLYHSSTTRN